MSTLELLQLQNEHKANTFFEKGEDAERGAKEEDITEEIESSRRNR